MSFLNTLQASRTAIDFFSDRLSLIGTNIASAQTAGYDRQRQLPSDNFYQQLSAVSPAGGTSTAGGVRQVGVESIRTVGELNRTGQSTDIAINGRGYLPVQDPVTGQTQYTRVGSFDLNEDGFLALESGHQLLGIAGEAPAFQVSLDAQNNLVFTVDPSTTGATPGSTGSVLQLQADGASWADDTLSFATSAPLGGRAFPTLDGDTILTGSALDGVLGGLNGGTGLDLGLSYTSFAALETVIGQGGVTSAQADAALLDATGGSGLTIAGTTYGSIGEIREALNADAVTLNEVDTALTAAAPGGLAPAWTSQSEIRSGLEAGLFTEADLNVALGASSVTVGGRTFDGSAGNTWSDLSDILPVNPQTGQPYTLAEIEEASPQALGVAVGEDGTVRWQFSNGTNAPAAWLRLADVRDPNSLQEVGQGVFSSTDETVFLGDWQSNVPGENGRGPLLGGTLEMSNVDLTTEFADLLASQRSYQASSKMLGVMDELLSTAIQLRR